MKQLFGVLFGLALMPLALHAAGSEQIIKQRAKDLRDQNNARQGVTPPTTAPANTSQATAPATPAPLPPQTPRQQAMAKVQTDLVAIRPGTEPTADQKQRLANSLLQAAQGPARPSMNSVTSLANELAGALSQKLLTNASRSRLLQDLSGLLNPGTMQSSQAQDVVADIQALFKSSGVAEKDVTRVADAAKDVAAEMQKKPGK